MDAPLDFGALGEEYAVNYLKRHGFRILERNWRCKRAEIDIVAKERDLLVFIEVKTRRSALFGHPSAFLSNEQELRISDAAGIYMAKQGYEWAFRFDLISIVIDENGEAKIDHFRDAFFPGGE